MNASPLICLAKAQIIDLLPLVCGEFRVPFPVAQEIARGGDGDPAASWLKAHEDCISAAPSQNPELDQWSLDPGELSVLASALSRKNWGVVVDDRAARNCAKNLGIPFMGTLGIITAAKRGGLIAEARPLVERLLQTGIYIDTRTVNALLRSIGE